MNRTYSVATIDKQTLRAVLDETGMLTISGHGVTEEWISPDYVPWKEERDLIRFVRFDKDVQVENLTNWFSGCENLVEIINWPINMTKMQATCCDCHKLKVIPSVFPENLKDMDEAFIRCYSLESVPELPPSVVYAADTFVDCFALSGHITIRGPISQFANMFENTGKAGAGVVLDYTASCAETIDQILETKADGSVTKGSQIN